MRFSHPLSLRQKLMAVMTLTSVIVLLVASTLFIAKEIFQFRNLMRAELMLFPSSPLWEKASAADLSQFNAS